MKTFIRKPLKKFLKLFIKIDTIPFTDNGKAVEYCTMHIFGLFIASQVYPAKNKQI